MTRYYCETCKLGYIDADNAINEQRGGEVLLLCPGCGGVLSEHCKNDHPCKCAVHIHGSIAYCPDCGHAICPTCGCHDVAQISRITGYLNAVDGFNAAKKQELKDRTRYNAITGEVVK